MIPLKDPLQREFYAQMCRIERDAMRRAEIYHQLSLGRKHQMFAAIAYETFEQGESLIAQERLKQRLLDYLVTVPDAPERIDIDAKAVLKAIEAQRGADERSAGARPICDV